MSAIWSLVIPGIAAFLGVLVPQLFARRKTRAESRKTEAEAESIRLETDIKRGKIIERLDSLETALNAKIFEVKTEITNSHSSNIREDIDNLLFSQSIAAKQYLKHGEDLKGLHEDFARFTSWTESNIGDIRAGIEENSKDLNRIAELVSVCPMIHRKPPDCQQ